MELQRSTLFVCVLLCFGFFFVCVLAGKGNSFTDVGNTVRHGW